MKKVIIQITAGKGPAECCRAVALVLQLILEQAKQKHIETEILDNKKGEIEGTLLSGTLTAAGGDLESFIVEWSGTIQWIAQSLYRRNHKRKNWFVGVSIFDIKELPKWDLKDVKFETTRASGPGGQNVNKVETAVRGIHQPSGLQVFAMDSRSQLENKKLCVERLQAKVMAWQMEQLMDEQQSRWLEHHALQRGNPVKIIRDNL
ncbi:peptide chain release factor [Mucilaginibacter frigoritolerans]|uniref:Peptide chain release factor n=1 Tax=Mucilaginibacter frigoritolerans TaxID=652788 RepID=A0A562UC77_9SPHI|nr:peptide chain release factor H [Mucilaginibacter frigoritolerans]TWJ03388.1 peptide chain release factor [Mucilaginibacter frigoritolerans]